MTASFDPSALARITDTFDDSEITQISDLEISRLESEDLRRNCYSIKLASRIVALAGVLSKLENGDIIKSMDFFMRRLNRVRAIGLGVVGVKKNSSEYPIVFNAITDLSIDLLTEEWKWSKVEDNYTLLNKDELEKLFQTSLNHSMPFITMDNNFDIELSQKLLVLKAYPKLWGVVNLFDFFQPDSFKLVTDLAKAVSKQAERYAEAMRDSIKREKNVMAVFERSYNISLGMMCEIYKEAAKVELIKLEAMPDHERSIFILTSEGTGIGYSHIIFRHQDVMSKIMETTDLIIEAQNGK